MSLKPNLREQELLADTFRRASSSMTVAERRVEILVDVGFAAAATGLWWIGPPHAFALLPVALCAVVMAVATRVRFDMPFGFTVPTQLAFIPLLFAAPVAIVPVAVAAALMIARVPDVLAGRIRASRLLLTVGNAWFAIGPVAVFAIANTEPRHAGPALLIAALGAQFIVDFVVSALRFGIGRGASVSAQLSETWVYAIDAALSPIALVVALTIHRHPVAALAPLPMLALLAIFAHERHQRLESLIELSQAYRGTALVLGNVVTADDGYTGEHSRGVVLLALALGEALRLDADQLRNLEFGALLHDVGKIAIPKDIINKPRTLDPQEWELIRTHTVEGQKLLDTVGGFMRTVGLIVRSHHERWDGVGYPDRLAGEAIPIESRIIACCDAWNAMRTDRAYRKALPDDAARSELVDNAGRQFDPAIVEAFLTLIEPMADAKQATAVAKRIHQRHRTAAAIAESSAP